MRKPTNNSTNVSQLDLERELKRLDAALLREPDDAELHEQRSKIWHRLGNVRCAIDDLTEVIRLQPQSAVAYHRRGFLWQCAGDAAKALEDYDEAIRLDPEDYLSFNNRGNARSELGDISGALSDLAEAIRLGNKYDARINRANVLFGIGDLHAALEDLDEVARNLAGSIDCHLWRGLTRLRLNQADGALEDLAKAKRIASLHSYVHPLSALVLYGHALAIRAKGDVTSADADAVTARSIDSGVEAKFVAWGLI
jgi:tetratricopeptide (TPR) repeat protein